MTVVKQEKYSSSFFFSLLLHVVIVVALIASFEWSSKVPVLENSSKNTQIINATVMSSIPTPTKMVPHPQPVIPKPKPVIPQPQPQPEKIIVKPKPISAPPKKQAIAISDKKEKKQQQDKLAQEMLADIKHTAHQQKKLKQKKLKQKELAAEFASDLKQMTAKSKQSQSEQKHITGARTQQMQGVVDKYKALLLQVISQNWLIPPSVNKNLATELMIRVAPGGVVLDVQIVKSSGDESLDRSAQAAVFKSSPLPVPKDADAFEVFRQFVLKARPKDILNTDNLVN